jgi:hypothetical protein
MLGATVGEGLGIGGGCELGKGNSGDCVESEDGLPVGLSVGPAGMLGATVGEGLGIGVG